MALTDEEKHLVYEVIGLPNAVSVLNVDGDYGTGRKFENYAITTAKTEIDAIMTALPDGGALESRLRTLLTAWLDVAIDGTRLKPNNENAGVDVNPARERSLIRTQVRRIVPVFLKGRDDDGSSGVALG